jgi:hypothetical protein
MTKSELQSSIVRYEAARILHSVKTKEFGEYPKLLFIANEKLRLVTREETLPAATHSSQRPGPCLAPGRPSGAATRTHGAYETVGEADHDTLVTRYQHGCVTFSIVNVAGRKIYEN